MTRNRETGKSDEEQGKEHPRRPAFLEARRYVTAEEAARAYMEAQEAIRSDMGYANLSIYRLQVGPRFESHVVVLGEMPSEALLRKLEASLGTGKQVDLTAGEFIGVLDYLMERRAQAERVGPWVEGHYRPGMSARLPRLPHSTRPPSASSGSEHQRRPQRPRPPRRPRRR